MKYKFKFLLFLSVLTLFIVLAGFATATNCGSITAQTTCDGVSDCKWHSDPWGSWCEQKGCYNLYDSTSCTQGGNVSSISYVAKNCTWSAGQSSGWCSEVNCWSLSGTNQSACESNSYNLQCTWRGTYNATNNYYPCQGPPEKQCWSKQTQATCGNVTGCTWGTCEQKSCWDKTTAATCTAAGSLGSYGNACKWNTQYNYCYESSCWDYTDITSCESASCKWSSGSCYKASCSDYSYTNTTACTSNPNGLNCQWNNPWCQEKDCWSYTTSNTCAVANSSSGRSCYWESYTGGWCEEVGCWQWDSWKGGTESICVSNAASYGLSCTWSNDTKTVNATDGWCYQNVNSNSCGSTTAEKACVDTFYCFWNATNSTCKEPSGTFQTDFIAWYPGCYLFDFMGQSACQNVTGCTWHAGEQTSICRGNTTINATDSMGGIRCAYLNNSEMCTKMTMLPTCCEWQAGTCVENKFSTLCWDQMEERPEGATYCEDYNVYTDKSLCEQISGEPWYMPCKWDNKSSMDEGDDRCTFKMSQVFESGKESVVYLDSKQSCESAGGRWITDMYCSNNSAIALPMGKCEFKFDEERNCNKECYACDFKFDGTNWTTSQKAKDACIGSKLGICGFISDTSAPNSYGYCNVKEQFKKGIATDCDSDCGSCTFMGDFQSSESEKRPSSFCSNSKKTGGCKWISDMSNPTDESKGRCASTSEKTCESKCDLCDEETNCVNKGAKKGNTSLATQCSWDNGKKMCLPTSGSNQMEVCWDGIDNDNNGKMDCADSKCFSDSFCGGNFMAGFGGQDCFGYTNNATCKSAGCEWTNESWGAWCDIPGSNCWKKDGNQNVCQADGNCSWHSGFGGFCEENWTMSNTCMGKINQSVCMASNKSGCTWVTDSYAQEFTGGQMGWCDPDWNFTGTWYDCAMHDTSGRDICENAGTVDSNSRKPCNWYNSTGGSYEGGWCDHMKFACSQFSSSQTDCTSKLNQSGYNHSEYCLWKTDQWGAWCEGKSMSSSGGSESCWSKTTQLQCTTANCNWKSGFCDPVGFGSELGFGGMAGGIGFGGSGSTTTMGGSGMNCMQNDGNQTACTGMKGCSWFVESNAFCGVNIENSCPQYSYNKTVCQSKPRCTYNDVANFCDEKPFMCSWNSSYTNAANCQANPLCYWSSWNSCEPICFNGSSSTTNTCGGFAHNSTNGTLNQSSCRWNTGWCNPSASTEFFNGMEGGAPTPLGTDTKEDAFPPEVDIVDFGLKDMGMGKSFGFGIRVASVQNSSMCNGFKLLGNLTGKGQNTTSFYWYLDTDGNPTNNCATRNDASVAGFEFYFSDSWTWGVSSGEAIETQDAYQCSEGSWKKAPIPISTFKQKACQEVSGGMIAVEKAELNKFRTLYNSSKDLRVYVATANSSGNVSNPSDTVSAGYGSPGSIDQDVSKFDLFKYKTNASEKVSESSNKGYIKYADVDCWTQTGCADYQCKGHPYCVEHHYGVEAVEYVDTRVPKVVGMIKETYPDAAVLMVFTDKPSNMSLDYFGPSSTCVADVSYPKVYDVGINNSDVNDFRLWHLLELNSETMGSFAGEGITGYYKLTFCDNSSKCGASKCSPLIMEPSQADCGPFCKFVAKIDTPSNWNVSYDIDQDGTYEHVQGRVCGANAGVYVNYTTGRRANIKLTKSDNSTYFEFINVTLTKTGLGTKMRDISDRSDSLSTGTTSSSSGTTFGYAGMLETTRDKIIHGLFPQQCKIKIPKGTAGCSKLYHCDENDLTKCVDRTASATSLENGTDYCIWKIPCEFSVWGGGISGSSSPPTSSSSSSGGGGGEGGSCASGYALVSGKCVKTEAVAEEPAKSVEEVKEQKEDVLPSETVVEVVPPEENVGQEALADQAYGGVGKILIGIGLILAAIVVVAVLLGVFKYIQKRRSK